MIIHIGKCGGSNLVKKFREIHNLYIISKNEIEKKRDGPTIIKFHCHNAIHSDKEINNLIKDEDIAILIRDPIKRFISIFFHYYDNYTKGILDKSYNSIYNRFKTPNQLAEALDSDNSDDQALALSAFTIITHLRFDFNFHLGNNRIKRIYDSNNKVFIIRQEHYKNDFKLYYKYLTKKFNLKNEFDKFFVDIKNNTNQYNNLKKLSERAISNLKKQMILDYRILDELCKYNFISKEYLNSLT